MKRLADQIKQALNALAYADVGDPIGRRAKYAALNPGQEAAPAPAHAATGRKLIALGVGDVLPAEVMTYVRGACLRMHADLLLIATDADRVRALLAPYLADLRGIQCQTEEIGGATRRAVVRVLQQRANILFAVSGTPDDPVRALLRGRRGLLEAKTPVPVVMVGKEPAKTPNKAGGMPRLAAY
jgi:hypothetical protein